MNRKRILRGLLFPPAWVLCVLPPAALEEIIDRYAGNSDCPDGDSHAHRKCGAVPDDLHGKASLTAAAVRGMPDCTALYFLYGLSAYALMLWALAVPRFLRTVNDMAMPKA